MGYSNGVVLAPVGMGDISRATGNTSLDIGTLVTSPNSNIGKWPKFKPLPDMNKPDVWMKRGDNYVGTMGTLPARMGNVREHNIEIGGVQLPFLTAFGMEIPIVKPTPSNPTAQKEDIINRSGAAGFNWDKTTAWPWYWYRMLDFDGFKPSATFPFEYMEDGREIDPLTSVMDVGARYVETYDQYRLFPGDLGEYLLQDKLVWATVLRRTVSGTPYYSDIIYTDENGHQFKMSDYESEYSPYRGWVSLRVPNNFYYNRRGATLDICIFGYVPPNSNTGYDGCAFLLPSLGGLGTTNPVRWTIANQTINDPLLKLTFDVSAGKWGKDISTPSTLSSMKSFPQGIPGFTLQSSEGVNSQSTFVFSLTFTNNTSSTVVLNLGNLAFDVTLYDQVSFQAQHTERIIPTFYDSSRNIIGSSDYSKQISAGSSLTIYVSLGNIWLNQSADTTSNYADMLGIRIINTSYPDSTYSKPSAFFFAKKRNISAWSFACTWDANANRMLISS